MVEQTLSRNSPHGEGARAEREPGEAAVERSPSPLPVGRKKRSPTISLKQLTREAVAAARTGVPPEPLAFERRPKTRAECCTGIRPCPFVSCKWNLYLDVDEKLGSIKFNFPDIEPDEMTDSCALDIADEGGTILDRIGKLMNVTRERVRQMEDKALAKLGLSPELALPEETASRELFPANGAA